MIWRAPQSAQERAAWLRRKRHPLCPRCRHDLLSTLMENLRRCPECGYEFDVTEVRIGWAAGDWTGRDGLRKLAVELAWRGAICFVVWVGCVWLTVRIESHHWWSIIENLELDALFGIALQGTVSWTLGHVMSRRLEDRIGFTGAPVLVITLAWFAIVLLAGGFIVLSYAPQSGEAFLSLFTWFVGMFPLLRNCIEDL